MSWNQQRKECHRNIHRFARIIFNDDSHTSVQPTFSKQEVQSFFTNIYSETPKLFAHPSWMPKPPPPTVPMVTSEFTEEEVTFIVTKSNSASTSSPVDQIPYVVLKKCPSLTPTLLHISNACWTPHVQKVKPGRLASSSPGEEEGRR